MLRVPLFDLNLLLTLFGNAWDHECVGSVAYFALLATVMRMFAYCFHSVS